MKKLNTLTLKETIKLLKAKEISHAELYRDIHASITENNEKYNIYLTLDNEGVKKAEKLLDTPLAGAPRDPVLAGSIMGAPQWDSWGNAASDA